MTLETGNLHNAGLIVGSIRSQVALLAGSRRRSPSYANFWFLWKLRFDNIEAVSDVRNNPYSRNQAFSQHALNKFLEQNGICYVYAQQLGVPASLRLTLRTGGNLNDYFAAYQELLRGEEATVAALMPMLLEKRCGLLCLEKNPAECHRSVLADWIPESRVHLVAKDVFPMVSEVFGI